MKGRWALFLSAGLGAGLMYLLDPQRGRRRRALLRNQMVHSLRKTTDAIDTTSRDLINRSRGINAQLRSWLSPAAPVSNEVLEARVRAQLGRLVSHPHSITVSATDGRVTLSGPILADEVEHLLDRVAAIRGVKAVENALEIHEQADNVPGLQGQPARRGGERSEFMQSNWSPAARFIAGITGGTLALYGMGWRGLRRTLLGGAGLTLLARAVTNMELRHLTGIGARRRAIDIHKTINIAAPVERVFELWSNFENFPHFMTNVRHVRRIDDQHSHWTVAGPAGMPVEWNSVITAYEPQQKIAWKTTPDSPVQHTGSVQFTPNPDGSTKVDVRLTYNPVAGGIGHAVAALFGADPENEMHDDLMRMKTFIETGVPPHDAAQPAGQEARREYH